MLFDQRLVFRMVSCPSLEKRPHHQIPLPVGADATLTQAPEFIDPPEYSKNDDLAGDFGDSMWVSQNQQPGSKSHQRQQYKSAMTYDQLINGLIRQPDIIFRNRPTPCLRADKVVELGLLYSLSKIISTREAMQY